MRKSFALLFTTILTLAFSFACMAADVKVPATKPADAAKAAVAEKKSEAKTSAKQEMIDINSATEEQLKGIPGVGDTYAKKVIAGRPYAKKDQLVSRNILPKQVYDKIKDGIIAKQAKK